MSSHATDLAVYAKSAIIYTKRSFCNFTPVGLRNRALATGVHQCVYLQN